MADTDTEFDADETLRVLRLTIKQMASEGDRDYRDIWVAHAKEVVEMVQALDTAFSSGRRFPSDWAEDYENEDRT